MALYAEVLFLSGMPYPLNYSIPLHLQNQLHVGSIVLVPLQKKSVWGWVVALSDYSPQAAYEIKTILEVYPLEDDYKNFIEHLAHHHASTPATLYKYLLTLLKRKDNKQALRETERIIKTNYQLPLLNNEQQIAFDTVCREKNSLHLRPFLLHGITGSGKTAVYAHLIAHTHHQHQSSIMLAPEITLAQSLAHSLRELLPDEIPIIELHSALTQSQKNHAINTIINKTPAVFIGVHIPIMLPVTSLGLCIIDEEHDAGYQEKQSPYIHTKDASLLRTYYQKIPIILGSATPSITSLYFAKQKKYTLLTLKNRYFDGHSTQLIHTHFESKKNASENSWISPTLQSLLHETLEKNEQALLFINRKGTHCYAECTACKKVLGCAQCSTPYTVHHYHLLKCHHCFACIELQSKCPQCDHAAHAIIKKGIGTEQVHHAVRRLFPHAKIERIDLDSIADKKQWQVTISRMKNHEIDILIGTHAIIKGYHFPKVTFAAAIWADMHLYLPHYLAHEHTTQNLIQMAGRVGRESLPGTVLMQTMHAHDYVQCINEKTYLSFYERELSFRKSLNYPPYCKCALILIKNKNELAAQDDAKNIAEKLQLQNHDNKMYILGPAPAPLYKIKNIYTMIVMLKAPTYSMLTSAAQQILKAHYASTVHYVPNPVVMHI